MIGGVGGGRHTSGLGHGVVSHWFVPILEQEEEEGAGHLSSGMEWHRASVAAAPALLQGWWMEGWPCLSLCHMGACPSSSWDSSGEVDSTVWACVACAASAARCSLLCQHLGPQLHPRVLGRGGCGTWPLVTPSLHRTPLLLGTFTNYISRFSHFEAALGASWLIATSPIMIGRRASDFQAMADLWLSELANEHGENELFRLT